ncbi:MAG TPA: ATP-binding protein [Thermoanaerobaculia bacterium]|nr:ATP-binding protein [Thermoanaerobaculia bacterium]
MGRASARSMDVIAGIPRHEDIAPLARGAQTGALGVVAVSLGMVLFVAFVDYVTGSDVSVSLLYLVPICHAAWSSGRRAGLAVAVASAAAWMGVILLAAPSVLHSLVLVWNAMMMAGIFAVVAVLLAGLERAHASLEATLWRRTASLRHEVEERRRAEHELREANAELQRTQMRLIDAAKMETVGRFAAGVAHEVKNPLMTLGMGADYFLQRRPSNAAEATLGKDMKDAVQRAGNIINLMLDFSTPRPLVLSREDLNGVVENSLALVRHQLASQRISVVRQMQPGLLPLSLDRTRMEHVLVNLFTNAAQAMPNGGTLTVRTASTGGSGADAPRQVVLDVEDTGPGLPEEHQSKVFEPFFTTKPPGQGTGLGLAIVHRIVQIHGGSVSLANRPEGGARATLRFHV